jgi:CubicO group peptidase (beta-lactamase class C family)
MIGRAAVCLCAIVCLCGCARRDASSPQGDPKAERVDAFMSELTSPGEPGAAVLVVENGRVAFERGYGVAELRTGRPIDARTNFRLASVSKQFTAVAIMLLVRDGRLSYESRLTGIFPDFPDFGREITVKNLLQHTSGLPDYEDLMAPIPEPESVDPVQIKDDEVLDLLNRTRAPLFPPGTAWKYSNSGYVVLGLIAEKISGAPFDIFLAERIFAPLKMGGTVAYVRGKNTVSERAYGHGRAQGRWRETDQSPTSATLGDGGIYSSLSDLVRWDDSLNRRTLLGEEDMRTALEPVQVPGAQPVEPDGTPASYGFGWFLNPWKGHTRMWHYGETRGFRTAIHRFPDAGITVVVLANRSDLDAGSLALRTAEVYLRD